jgi:hypothetical protein
MWWIPIAVSDVIGEASGVLGALLKKVIRGLGCTAKKVMEAQGPSEAEFIEAPIFGEEKPGYEFDKRSRGTGYYKVTATAVQEESWYKRQPFKGLYYCTFGPILAYIWVLQKTWGFIKYAGKGIQKALIANGSACASAIAGYSCVVYISSILSYTNNSSKKKGAGQQETAISAKAVEGALDAATGGQEHATELVVGTAEV